jgi:hypothetical protein
MLVNSVVSALKPFTFLRRQRLRVRQGVLSGAEQQGEWRPEFVADIAEECRFGPVDFGQRFEALAFFFHSDRVGDVL